MGCFPAQEPGEFDLLGTGLHLLGMVIVLAVVFVTTSMMCKITFQQLRGDDFYSVGDAWQFAKAHWQAVLFGPLTLLALFALFAIGGMVIGAISGWIPVAGRISVCPVLHPHLFCRIVGRVYRRGLCGRVGYVAGHCGHCGGRYIRGRDPIGFH